jgi:hypothetical protein
MESNNMRSIWMMIAVGAALAAFATSPATAAEPNEDFESATVLSAGVLLVSDELVQAPDTFLGIRNFLGAIVAFDDDGSSEGNGKASGLKGISTQDGSIQFAVTGWGDDDFSGNHSEAGEYEVFVQTYDSFGDAANLYRQVATLQPGAVDDYSLFDDEAFLGTYDVFIDNLGDFNVYADIDYFTFTGLTPGATFTAKTLDPDSVGLDTLLGWYSDDGFFIGSDDDGGGDGLSLLSGTIPANGRVTLAVTGTGDDAFVGDHIVRGAYDLKLTIGGGVDYAADFNNDGKVNGLDLAAWKTAFGATNVGDADNDNDSDGADYLVWQRQFGSGGASVAAASAVPEPAAAALLFSAAVGATVIGRLRQPPRR